ncbi:MAG: DUF2007 domain-containing protein [Acidobacteria bacterium]|nr:DUF2007 domain-containing protein [Acidobacteriota bacterium]
MPRSEGAERQFVTIASVPSLMEAELVKGLLRSGEIDAIIPDSEMLRMEPHLAHVLTASSGFEVQVPREDVEAAREMLDSGPVEDDEQGTRDDHPECPRCSTPLARVSSPDAARIATEKCLRCGYVPAPPSPVPGILFGFASAVLAALLIYAGGFSTSTLIGVLIIAVAFRTGWQKLTGDEKK